ncbi:M20 family metallopeptidase [Streptomyces odontomachi]|uniref:M20 family metallopeptidase n=1 Tax=Streptomyces odontomachi TaxID=2944940 RepID=UPI00210E572F|nr:M20/M25/M40 family metallo-hydrolase [Streptomyces sp. ODS25]
MRAAETPGVDRERALETLRRMVRFDSRTETPQESSVVDWLLGELAGIGLRVHRQPVGPGRYNAIGVWPGSGSGTSLMFNGHVDTNPLTEGWTVDPWGGLVDETFVYGLGVSNMKAGCASYLEAVRALAGAGLRPRGDVLLTFVVGELQGGVGTRRLIEDGWRADCFVNCEPTDLTALTAHAGALTFEVELHGSTRHMSKREEAADALAAAADLVPALNALTFAGAATAEAHRVNRTHVGVVRSGLGSDLLGTRPPQVADVARLAGSARYGQGQTPDTVLAELTTEVERVCLRHPGVRAAVARTDGAGPTMDQPFFVDPEEPVVTAVNAAYRAVRGEAQLTGAIRPYCFYGSDASLLQHAAGMPGLVCGPGGKYNTMPDERVEISDYLDMARVHQLTIDRICGLAG